jgi:hypothetical protein
MRAWAQLGLQLDDTRPQSVVFSFDRRRIDGGNCSGRPVIRDPSNLGADHQTSLLSDVG